MIELRLGRYQDVLRDVTCDAVIADPPYTSRVMFGYRSGSMIKKGVKQAIRKPTIPYAAMDRSGAAELAAWATGAARHWIVLFNDHVGWAWLADAIRHAGWYVFPPVIWHAGNSPPRFQGDGPNDPHEYIVVARPRKVVRVGSLPGRYDKPRLNGNHRESIGLVGQKPLALMREVLGHYSRPGWSVCDPFAGSGSTLIAAHQLGRRALGAEMDAKTHDRALDRIVQHVLNGGDHGRLQHQTSGRDIRNPGGNSEARACANGRRPRRQAAS